MKPGENYSEHENWSLEEFLRMEENSPIYGEVKFDLLERTAKFGETAILFALEIPVHPVTSPLISQFVKSATSVGANYGEASEAESGRDFRHKIAIALKELKETAHWLRMIATAAPAHRPAVREIWRETVELTKIFSQSIRTSSLRSQ